jgi:hypothetical protein
MPRPKSKDELLSLSQSNFEKLFDFIDSLSEKEQNTDFPDGTMNRNIRDVLAHLYHWHKMMLSWYDTGSKGEKPEIPAKGYTWKTTPALNREIWKMYKTTALGEARKLLVDSHQEVMSLIRNHNDEELFEKKRYKWTGSTSLGAYLISATSSHYDWALKLIKKAKIKKV